MGGRALKLVHTRRYELEEYLKLQDELVEILSNDFTEVAVPLYFRNKKTFGDIDIIVTYPKDTGELTKGEFIRKYIEDSFNPGEIFHNDNAWSFNVDEIQVDIIMCDEENFDSFYHYLAYNDLGNLIGRIAHSLGLKYAQEGLVYDHYFQGSKVGRILVSKDYPRIFEFLGLDYKAWQRGFDDLEDVFSYIVNNKHFSYERYQLNSLNKINRERNLKRASYLAFLEYIEDHKEKIVKFNEDKTQYVLEADKFFPEFEYKLETRRMEYEKTKKLYIQTRFNGGEVKRRFGLDGKEIGEAMEGFKNRIAEIRKFTNIKSGSVDEEFDDYILNNTLKTIYYHFGEFLKKDFKR